ncbi:PhzF family phenazine biosynthesis protein [Mucilaginibacter sp. R-33]|uniref:PhzF family phenazine biosynthesis protein n=1 Tax=unclassified Mucilaginibacter TaxID=2617802 RepID=UPI003CE790C6
MKIKIYQVDAFTDTIFKGNPAAVCPLEEWLDDDILLRIAKENNLSETAFYVRRAAAIEIRWFTPNTEVDLCGHATLATAFVLHQYEDFSDNTIPFHSPRSGTLPVTVQRDKYVLDFPADQFSPVGMTAELLMATDKVPIAAYKGKTDFMLVFKDQEDIATLEPRLQTIANLDARGVIVTAKGVDSDFVSRFFAPAVGVNEDPVTGSAHTTLIPYWAAQMAKTEFLARQLSERSGELQCRLLNNRVNISGRAVLYMQGEIMI